jgi:hypothetical protein
MPDVLWPIFQQNRHLLHDMAALGMRRDVWNMDATLAEDSYTFSGSYGSARVRASGTKLIRAWSGDKKQYAYHEPDIRVSSRLAV